MADDNSFLPGTIVRVALGAFVGRVGVILDPKTAIDGMGNPFPATASGHYWVMLDLNDAHFTAHLFHDDLEPIAARGDFSTQS
jgi:hypothetical protein